MYLSKLNKPLIDFFDDVNEAVSRSIDDSIDYSLDDICRSFEKTAEEYETIAKTLETEGVTVVYGNYCEKVYYNREDQLYHGEMRHKSVRGLITFGGRTYKEALDDFAAAIEKYVDEGPRADDWLYNPVG